MVAPTSNTRTQEAEATVQAGLEKGQLLFPDFQTPAVVFLGGLLLCFADSYA